MKVVSFCKKRGPFYFISSKVDIISIFFLFKAFVTYKYHINSFQKENIILNILNLQDMHYLCRFLYLKYNRLLYIVLHLNIIITKNIAIKIYIISYVNNIKNNVHILCVYSCFSFRTITCHPKLYDYYYYMFNNYTNLIFI